MTFFQDVGQKITDAARSAVDASEKFIEVTKLNTSVKSEEIKINDLMYEIGKSVYGAYSEGRPVDEELNDKCSEIAQCEKNISELKEKILEVKNVKQCPGCSSQIDRDSIYCPKCGTKVGE